MLPYRMYVCIMDAHRRHVRLYARSLRFRSVVPQPVLRVISPNLAPHYTLVSPCWFFRCCTVRAPFLVCLFSASLPSAVAPALQTDGDICRHGEGV